MTDLRFIRAFEGDVVNIIPADKAIAHAILELPTHTVFTLKLATNQRTNKQNNAIHQYLRMVAKKLREAGIDARKFFKPSVEIPITMEMLKEDAWHPIQMAILQKESTADLTRAEVNKVYEVFDRHLAQSHGVHVPFPSRGEG